MHGWTKADAKTLRTIAAGLRHYLVNDYKARDIVHSREASLSKYGHASIKTINPAQSAQLNIAADYGRKAWRAGHSLSPGTDASFQEWRRSVGLHPTPANYAWMSGWREAKAPDVFAHFMSGARDWFSL